jgi:hypothetical protein
LKQRGARRRLRRRRLHPRRSVVGSAIASLSVAMSSHRRPVLHRRARWSCCCFASQSRLILFGRSLGGAVVIHLAAQLEQARPT